MLLQAAAIYAWMPVLTLLAFNTTGATTTDMLTASAAAMLQMGCAVRAAVCAAVRQRPHHPPHWRPPGHSVPLCCGSMVSSRSIVRSERSHAL